MESFRSAYRVVSSERYKIYPLFVMLFQMTSGEKCAYLIVYLPMLYILLSVHMHPVRLCGCLKAVTICCQTAFAVAFMHTFSVENVFLPVRFNFLLPVSLVLLFTSLHGRST